MTDDLEEQLSQRLHARAAAVTPSPPARSDLDRRIRHRQRRRIAVTGSVAAVALAAGAATALSLRDGGGNGELVSAAHPDEPSAAIILAPTTSLAMPATTAPRAAAVVDATTVPPPPSTAPTTISPTSTTVASSVATTPVVTTAPVATTTVVIAPPPTTTIPTTPPRVRPTACDSPERAAVALPDTATVEHLLVGNWLACDRPSFFGTDDAGLAIGADGHWAKLARTGAGDLVEMDGRDNRGSWKVLDTSSMNGPGHFQINLTSLTGGTRMSSVVLIAPAKLVLNNMGVSGGTYVPANS
jgi:hypothetical protein